MKVEHITAIHLDESEEFTITYRDSPHRVRLVKYYRGNQTVDLYGAKVAKNGAVNKTRTPILERPLDILPDHLRDILVALDVFPAREG